MVSQSQYKRVQDPNNSWVYTTEPWLHSSVQRDNDGKTIAFCHDINNLGTYKTSLRYGTGDDEDKSYVYGVALNGSERLEYGYNPLGQRTRRTLKLGGGIIRNTTYEFLKNTWTDDLSPFVKTLTNQGGQKYSYTYNSSGYITKVQSTPASGEGDTETTEYFYDAKGQLIRCNDSIAGTNEYYTYDKGGNILSRTVYPYDTSSGNAVTTSYTYDNEDKLISFNGQSITYDEMGNPMQYRDSMSMSWSAGRQLSYMYKGYDCLMFDYNADGIRTKKQAGSNTTEYLISDGVLTALKFDENTGIYFMRDESGVPYGFTYTYDGIYALTDYYYQYNLQGDVVAILDSSGNIVAKYDYDAWGKLISMTDGSGNDISNEYNHIGRLNPLRYRGYIYDEETSFYYLGSRYYDPVTGRFINADSQINDGSHVLGTNLYAYCYNNPVNYVDSNGRSAVLIISGYLIKSMIAGLIAYCGTKFVLGISGEGYLASKGYELSQALYNHGMFGGGSGLSEEDQILLLSKILLSPTFTKAVDAVIRSIANQSHPDVFVLDFVEFVPSNYDEKKERKIRKNETDLYYSLQKVGFIVHGTRRNDGRWNMEVTIFDTYNFDEMRPIWENGFNFGNAANDLGLGMQYTDMMVPYKISVSYSVIW